MHCAFYAGVTGVRDGFCDGLATMSGSFPNFSHRHRLVGRPRFQLTWKFLRGTGRPMFPVAGTFGDNPIPRFSLRLQSRPRGLVVRPELDSQAASSTLVHGNFGALEDDHPGPGIWLIDTPFHGLWGYYERLKQHREGGKSWRASPSHSLECDVGVRPLDPAGNLRGAATMSTPVSAQERDRTQIYRIQSRCAVSKTR